LGVAAGPPIYGWLMGMSQMVMFFSTAGLTLVVAFLAMVLIRVKDKQPSESKKNTLFKKLQLNTE